MNILKILDFLISSKENNSELTKNEYLTVDPIDEQEILLMVLIVAIMLSYKITHCEFAIIYDPINNVFYHT